MLSPFSKSSITRFPIKREKKLCQIRRKKLKRIKLKQSLTLINHESWYCPQVVYSIPSSVSLYHMWLNLAIERKGRLKYSFTQQRMSFMSKLCLAWGRNMYKDERYHSFSQAEESRATGGEGGKEERQTLNYIIWPPEPIYAKSQLSLWTSQYLTWLIPFFS